ncbi:MAG TPA: RNA polymerase sigma factor [Polyangiales bacterium]|nr:RNA polymerase sigma factor [Polyangiales bacterium]
MGRLVNLHPQPDQNELDLIAACRRGERPALERVFRTHAPYLERVLWRVAGRSLDVEDLLQTTLMAAIEAFPRFRGEAQVRTWLARIAVRIAQDRLRSASHRLRAQLPDLEAMESHNDHDAEHDLDLRRKIERLELHLSALGPKKRTAFVLHVFEGMPLEEVAALTGAGLAATKSRVFWARRELLKRAARDPWLRELALGGQR